MHILSAGVVVVHNVDGEYRYLLLRAFQHWDFPKGMVEAGESPIEAAIREVWEETTLQELQFHWTEQYKETGPYGRGKVARYYIAETLTDKVDLPINPALGHAEHEEFRWVSFEQAKQLISPRVRTVLEWAHDIIKYHNPRN
ncbi:MAG: NUDIX domain-containing protein [Gammaproteobacteria bacterium]|nr:NUDIX domain-containing protein [Gammaproteobacteria bacterium]